MRWYSPSRFFDACGPQRMSPASLDRLRAQQLSLQSELRDGSSVRAEWMQKLGYSQIEIEQSLRDNPVASFTAELMDYEANIRSARGKACRAQ